MLRKARTAALTFLGRGRRTDAEAVQALPVRPVISIAMPTYESDPRYLREAIESVRRQRYPHWELCIADDGSRGAAVRRVLERERLADQRIKVSYLERNAGISAATNAAVALCGGEFVAFLDHDDVLPSDALLRVAQVLAADSGVDVVYSDSDKLTLHGTRGDAFFKPDWSPTYALGAMYVGHLLVVRRALVHEAGGFDPDFDKIQDFEFMLRVSALTDRIHHIPAILYHWRAVPGSIAAGAEQKSGIPELQAKAVTAHLRRLGVELLAEPHEQIPHRARIALDPDRAPDVADLANRVSVVIPWRGDERGLGRLLDSLEAASGPRPGEVLVVAAEAPPVGDRDVRVIANPDPAFHRARAANLGAAEAGGDWLLFCSDAAELVEQNWLAPLLAHAALPGVAAVGPLLARPDGRTDSAGFAIGLDHPALPMLAGIPADADGYYGALACARDVSALSGDFVLVRADAFRSAGGFEESFLTGYEDFDLCQRLRRLGSAVVYAPRPRVVVHDSAAERREALDIVDRALFVDRCYHELERGDPFFNPNFARYDASFATPG